MARSNLCLAAGGGVVAAFLLVGGPGAAAAIADPGGSHSGHGDHSDYRDGGYGHGGSKQGDDDRNGGDDNGQRPQTRVGSGGSGTQGDLTSEGPVSEMPAADRPGSDRPGAPTAKPDRPRVTFGNGRSPIVQRAEPPRVRDPIEVAPEPPPPPVVDTGPAPTIDYVRPPRIVVPQFDVAPSAAITDPLFGLAGMLLIPAAGAFVGYRQAKASQAVDVLRRP